MTRLRLILSALLPFAIGYFMSYLLRAVNAVVAPDLVKDLSLTPAQLGLLTAAYLGAFALFQLPLGVLLDRYGPRKVQSALLTVAAAGCLGFAYAPNFGVLFIARAVVGLGFSAGGLLFPYYVGVAYSLKDSGALVPGVTPLAGASAGSLIAACVGTGLGKEEVEVREREREREREKCFFPLDYFFCF